MAIYITMAEVAKLRGVSVSTVHRWASLHDEGGYVALNYVYLAGRKVTTPDWLDAMQRPKMGRPKGEK